MVTLLQDKRIIEDFRTSWDPAKYEAETGELRVLRKDLVQQRRWGRQVDQMKVGVCGRTCDKHGLGKVGYGDGVA
jgi:hypothetical protein